MYIILGLLTTASLNQSGGNVPGSGGTLTSLEDDMRLMKMTSTTTLEEDMRALRMASTLHHNLQQRLQLDNDNGNSTSDCIDNSK